MANAYMQANSACFIAYDLHIFNMSICIINSVIAFWRMLIMGDQRGSVRGYLVRSDCIWKWVGPNGLPYACTVSCC